jgi:competence protein ComEA
MEDSKAGHPCVSHLGPHDESRVNKGLFDVNTASEEELTFVELIRDSDARAIVQHRDSHGPFRSWEELQEVTGLDAKKVVELQRAACLVPPER